MSARDDDDILLHKASATLISDLRSLLTVILWRRDGNIHSLVRKGDLDRAVNLIEPFQEEPQLLDPYLKYIVPPLIDTYLQHLGRIETRPRGSTCSLSRAICKILYTLCKVRGEKVIVSFFNHDPPNFIRILTAFEDVKRAAGNDGSVPWLERYVLLLWLWHLMLVPFDLETLSPENLASITPIDGLSLPANIPDIPRRVIPICIDCMRSATKQREAAAKVLARLSLREDIFKYGLLDLVLKYVLQRLQTTTTSQADLHEALGHLYFLVNITNAAAPNAIQSFIKPIYVFCQNTTSDDGSFPFASNAVVRKLLIKICRNIALLCLQTEDQLGAVIDADEVLTEMIGSWLVASGDSDTPVRYAASKALSSITLKLQPDMASEVVDAILASLQEDVTVNRDGAQNTDAVDPLRWHGLTLTLAQLLYRRAPSSDTLASVLNALILSLRFSQRTTAGVSIGTNVRDAACFGIWALSRRYTTEELLAIEVSEIEKAVHTGVSKSTTLSFLASQLLTAACLDPAGNIRRGSSAALQELTGRHPDKVPEGISLVQVVDYQAVGLRKRAMVDIALRASQLDPLYWTALFSGLHEERGILAPDAASRKYAAESIGLFVGLRDLRTAIDTLKQIQSQLRAKGKAIPVEERHGLFLALASVLDQCIKMCDGRHTSRGPGTDHQQPSLRNDLYEVLRATKIIDVLAIPDTELTSATRRPELTVVGTCQLITSYSSVVFQAGQGNPDFSEFESAMLRIWHLLSLCLLRTDPEVLEAVPECVRNVLAVSNNPVSLIEPWIVASAVKTQSGARSTAHVTALGAAFSVFRADDSAIRESILLTIASRCGDRVDIEARVQAVRALSLTFDGFERQSSTLSEGTSTETQLHQISTALHTALNDYTINERGDVGSLVRLEALNAMEKALKRGLFNKEVEEKSTLVADVSRLSLEKLDKVRTVARSSVVRLSPAQQPCLDVSSADWFSFWLHILLDNSRHQLRIPILEGYVSSAGMGSGHVVQVSRSVLLTFLQAIPTRSEDDAVFSLLTFANDLLDVLRGNLKNERVLLPVLEVLAFLLDMQVLDRLVATDFKWRSLLSLVQKSHYQSKSIQKIHLALDVYRGLADVLSLSNDVAKKLKDMTRNPMPLIRKATEETLSVVQGTRSAV